MQMTLEQCDGRKIKKSSERKKKRELKATTSLDKLATMWSGNAKRKRALPEPE
jgi:hypothetical protein